MRESRSRLKLGSLFDGVGGFPLVASWHGIEPVWASEIVPACISITKRHFPDMKHLGDITQINGAEIEPVDIITFGSPCQDLSVAGKRAGLAGERSGLFGEAIRIIDEMRGATNDKYPAFAIWENVPGALSSNGGLDFRAVLQAFAETEIPMPKSGKGATAGMVRGSCCDIAWRIVDAQHWGVPQRRRRVFVVADFGGQCAGEVLFKPESLRRNFAQGGAAREEVAGGAGSGVAKANSELYENHAQDSRVTGPLDVSPTVSQKWGTGGGNTPIICAAATQANAAVDIDLCPTLTCMHEQPYIVKAYACRTDQTGSNGLGISEDIGYTLDGSNGQAVVPIGIDSEMNAMSDKMGTMRAHASGGAELFVKYDQIIRRLTPLEAERLQGFPDQWTAMGHDGKPISDAARYRALGNSVALPCVDYVLGGIAEVLI